MLRGLNDEDFSSFTESENEIVSESESFIEESSSSASPQGALKTKGVGGRGRGRLTGTKTTGTTNVPWLMPSSIPSSGGGGSQEMPLPPSSMMMMGGGNAQASALANPYTMGITQDMAAIQRAMALGLQPPPQAPVHTKEENVEKDEVQTITGLWPPGHPMANMGGALQRQRQMPMTVGINIGKGMPGFTSQNTLMTESTNLTRIALETKSLPPTKNEMVGGILQEEEEEEEEDDIDLLEDIGSVSQQGDDEIVYEE